MMLRFCKSGSTSLMTWWSVRAGGAARIGSRPHIDEFNFRTPPLQLWTSSRTGVDTAPSWSRHITRFSLIWTTLKSGSSSWLCVLMQQGPCGLGSATHFNFDLPLLQIDSSKLTEEQLKIIPVNPGCKPSFVVFKVRVPAPTTMHLVLSEPTSVAHGRTT